MPKVEINPIQNLDNPSSAVGAINSNFDNLQAIIETLLSRDGRVPNSMAANLDLNEYRILNLPVPVSPLEPARHGDIQSYVDQAESFRNETEDFRDETEDFRDEVEFWYNGFGAKYLGAQHSNPVVDNLGLPLTVGAIYFNTNTNNWKVFALDDVHNEGDAVYAGNPPVVIGYWIPFPTADLLTLNDVDAGTINNNQILQYQGGFFVPVSFSAENLSFDDENTLLNASTVQTAIEDLVDRTSLGRYDISFYIQGLMGNNESLFRMVASRDFVLPVELPDSAANARIGANNNTTILIFKNSTQIGTVSFGDGDTTGTFTFAGTVLFNPGDVLELRAPSTADTLLRDVSITIAARR